MEKQVFPWRGARYIEDVIFTYWSETMKCPVCGTPDLLMTERQGVEIDYCPSCAAYGWIVESWTN